MIVDKLEDTLNGGFAGLYGEVVTEDIYGLRKLTWQPDIIFDLGGNVGVFSRFARTLFPDALIVAVEPDLENYTHFKKFTDDNNLILLNKAIGTGTVYRTKGAANGSGEVYLSTMTGYSKEKLEEDVESFTETSIQFITIEALVTYYMKHDMKALMKIDIEGSENSIFESPASMEALKRMDYLTIEIHKYALTGKEQPEVNKLTDEALSSLAETHYTRQEHVTFFAHNKKTPMEIKHRTQLVELLQFLKLPLYGVEVGVAEGYNSEDLLRAGMEKLYLVDIWQSIAQSGDASSPQEWHDNNFKAAVQRVFPYGDKVIVLKGFSAEKSKEIPDETLGLVYLDGDHSYNGAMADLTNYYPKLVSGGVMAGHDFLNLSYGVNQAVKDFCKEKGLEFHTIPETSDENASFWFQKNN